MNAQGAAETALFCIQTSVTAGAGAGVFVAKGVTLPDNFLVAGQECQALFALA